MMTRNPMNEGSWYFIKTATYFYVGYVEESFDGWTTLKEASWVADTGRLHQCLTTGTVNEAEFVGEIHIPWTAVISVLPWRHGRVETR